MSCHAEQELSTPDMLQGHIELHHHLFGYLKSMALRCAADLGVPSAIHRRGGAAMISDIAADTGVHPAKLPHLRRIMRVLTGAGIFAANDEPSSPADQDGDAAGETVYTLTPPSRLLVGDHATCNMAPMMRFLVRPEVAAVFFGLDAWLRDGDTGAATLYQAAHGGVPAWEMTKRDSSYSRALNEACAGDTSFVMDIAVREGGDVFRGLSSLVDVGGGHGAAAMAIARAFPHIKCSVLDLPQAISEAPADGTVNFVAGNMFEYIPPANAVFLKYVLHCWGEEDCIKILQQCKKAIPAKGDGGKVIIINAVVGSGEPQDNALKETQVLFDVYMMGIGGGEREEHAWKKIFLEAGFSDYKIKPILGFISVIEVYP
uniref:O-methyltransferase domain-containing protein n=1 Tax=Oryza nivara TaxID=4536 RepID=A0A0E0GZI1_ORYNI